MINLFTRLPGRSLELLCIGAHSDDIEIGCGGSVLQLLKQHPGANVTWVVLAAAGSRSREATQSARQLLRGAERTKIVVRDFDDGHFPAQFRELKACFEELNRSTAPDIILTHRVDDRHQDHRLVGELSWQTWRDHLILEYEIPKYEGDLGQPNLFVPLSTSTVKRKVHHLMRHFGSQRSKTWFQADTFESLMRLRGMECRSPSGFGEAFHARKLCLWTGRDEPAAR